MPGSFASRTYLNPQIVFTYANDLWVIPKDGGTAIKLSFNRPVSKAFPKFSPDGKSIAFSGNYDGNLDAYVIPVSGGRTKPV